jgi:hypothetical protein
LAEDAVDVPGDDGVVVVEGPIVVHQDGGHAGDFKGMWLIALVGKEMFQNCSEIFLHVNIDVSRPCARSS